MSGNRKVLVVSASSVTRALLLSLLGSAFDEVKAAESLPRAMLEMASMKPDVVIVEAAIVRASPDALDRLRGASPTQLGIVLADRGYSDERRGTAESRAFGASAFIAIPPDAASLIAAVGAAIGDSINLSIAAPVLEAPGLSRPPEEAEQMGRYIERLWSRLATLDAYQLLRVSPGATDLEIKAAFRERALEFHPDRQHGILDEEARERVYQIFKRVSWAFRKVGDVSSRKEYDASQRKA